MFYPQMYPDAFFRADSARAYWGTSQRSFKWIKGRIGETHIAGLTRDKEGVNGEIKEMRGDKKGQGKENV